MIQSLMAQYNVTRDEINIVSITKSRRRLEEEYSATTEQWQIRFQIVTDPAKAEEVQKPANEMSESTFQDTLKEELEEQGANAIVLDESLTVTEAAALEVVTTTNTMT